MRSAYDRPGSAGENPSPSARNEDLPTFQRPPVSTEPRHLPV
jgi:hypothetical protein